MTFDDWLVVGGGGCVAAFVALVVFQSFGSALLMALVVTCVLSTIVRRDRVVADDQRSETPPTP